MSALNPYMTIGNQMTEPLAIHDGVSGGEARERAVEALQSVGIQDAAKRLASYPHEFSGGMRQRVMIAMALITRPQLLIADEPTTALDVTVQAQILELIVKLQDDLGMAVILITHDLGVIANTADRVLVMYAGRMAEAAPAHELFDRPRHPYTKALMDSLPSVHGKGETLYTIPGLPPDLSDRPPGCPFAPRCEHAVESCSAEVPDLEAIGDNHASACLRVQRGEL
jgi:oligopeptide transport system ATP-binding protein